MNGAFLRRRDQTVRSLRVEHYSSAVNTGPNDDAGGPRDTLCHLDIPMRHCSVWLDDEPMVLKGEVIPEDQRAPGR